MLCNTFLDMTDTSYMGCTFQKLLQNIYEQHKGVQPKFTWLDPPKEGPSKKLSYERFCPSVVT